MALPRILRKHITYSKNVLRRHRSTEQSGIETKASLGSTVDSSNLKAFERLRNKWWNIDGELKALHSLNRIRVPLIRKGLANTGVVDNNSNQPLEGIKIADVGCGGGILSESLARIGAEVTGVDASSLLISVAEEHAKLDSTLSNRLNYVRTTIEDFSKENCGRYDAVVTSEVLEHVTDQRLFLKCCGNLLNPGGSLFITTINRTKISWLFVIVLAEYVFKVVPLRSHDWNKFISPLEVQHLLEICNCKAKLIHGMSYDPWKNTWTWTSSTAANYALQAIKGEEI